MKRYFILIALAMIVKVSSAQKIDSLEVTIQNSHSNIIKCQDFTPDGKYMVTASNDGAIKLWDTKGILIRNFYPIFGKEYHKYMKDEIESVAISPNGQIIAAIQRDVYSNNLMVWKYDGTVVSSIQKIRLDELEFSYDGSLLFGFGYNDLVIMKNDGTPCDTILKRKPSDPGSNEFVFMKSYAPDRLAVIIKKESYLAKPALPAETFLLIYDFKGNLIRENKIDVKALYSIQIQDKYLVATVITEKISDRYQNMVINLDDGTSKWTPGNYNSYRVIVDEQGEVIQQDTIFHFEYGHPCNMTTVHSYKPIPNQKKVLILTEHSAHIYGDDGSFICDLGVSVNKRFQSSISNNSKLVSINSRNQAHLWNFEDLSFNSFNGYSSIKNQSRIVFNPKKELTAAEPNILLVAFKESGIYSRDKELFFINTEGKTLTKSNIENLDGSELHISPDGSYLVEVDFNYVRIYDLTGKLIKELDTRKPRYDPEKIKGISFSKDGNFFMVIAQLRILIYNRQGQKKMEHSYDVKSAALSPDAQTVFCTLRDKFGFLDNKGNVVKEINIPRELMDSENFETSFTNMQFTPDGKLIVGVNHTKEIVFINLDGSIVKRFKGHSGQINSFSLSTDGKYLVSTAFDNTVRYWNIATGEHVILVSNDTDWIMYTPDGYYDASKNGGKLVGLTIGNQSYGIDQFALKYNRPDILLKRMGLGSQEIITNYENQFKKRLRKMGITETQLSKDFHVPIAKINSTDAIGKNVTISALLSDDIYNLKRYNIYVNDVPIYGSFGKEILEKAVSINESFEITKGNNKIEVSCINEKGAESYRALTYANYSGESKSDLYLLAFGVSKYQNQSYNLAFADKDAIDLSKVIEAYKGKGFENVYTKVLTNEQVTPEAIKTSKDFLQNAKPDDYFILFIAGHGMHDTDPEATYYYLTHNTDLKNLKGTAADFETIEDLLQGIPPRNKLFLMDACESGELDEEDEVQYLASATEVGVNSRGFKKTQGVTSTSSQLPATSSKRSYLYQKDRYIYNDLVRRSGAIVFSSSKGGELSYERSDIENGLFTEYIMKALTSTEADKDGNGTVSTDELRVYVSEQVAKASGGLQHPTVDRDNIYQKFGFSLR